MTITAACKLTLTVKEETKLTNTTWKLLYISNFGPSNNGESM